MRFQRNGVGIFLLVLVLLGYKLYLINLGVTKWQGWIGRVRMDCFPGVLTVW